MDLLLFPLFFFPLFPICLYISSFLFLLILPNLIFISGSYTQGVAQTTVFVIPKTTGSNSMYQKRWLLCQVAPPWLGGIVQLVSYNSVTVRCCLSFFACYSLCSTTGKKKLGRTNCGRCFVSSQLSWARTLVSLEE